MLADTTSSLLEINGTFFAEVIVFLVMLALLAKYVYPAIIKAATERQNQVEAALKAAEDAKADVAKSMDEAKSELAAAKESAREIIERSKREAATEADETRKKSQAEAQAQLTRARDEIAAERDKAMQQLRAEVGNLVVTAAGRVLGQSIDATAHRKLIDDSLAKVGPEEGSKN
jgi:F-type H+-transporting ATPase subunit b